MNELIFNKIPNNPSLDGLVDDVHTEMICVEGPDAVR